MPCSQTVYAHKKKAELIEKLGAKCALCPATDDLQLDHIYGRDYDLNKLSFSARISRYAREIEQNLIRLLCGDCNLRERKKNDNGQFVPTASNPPKTIDIPF